MQRRYATADVFTTEPLGGNPVTVVLDAEGLTEAQMQALAAEFNYIETTFVLPAADPRHTAHVRIFTPDRELPFAGHPNVGTAFLLARERLLAGGTPPERLVFEELVGLVAVDLMYEDGAVVGADLLSPQPLVRYAQVDASRAASCLGLAEEDVCTDAHVPQVVSVGLPFLVLELASREALRRARPDRHAYDDLFPLDGARSVYAYIRDTGQDGPEHGCDLHARMFTWRMVEDPATGSATAAVTALLAELHGAEVRLRVRQGEDMGRPSTLLTCSVAEEGATRARVGGRCRRTMCRHVQRRIQPTLGSLTATLPPGPLQLFSTASVVRQSDTPLPLGSVAPACSRKSKKEIHTAPTTQWYVERRASLSARLVESIGNDMSKVSGPYFPEQAN